MTDSHDAGDGPTGGPAGSGNQPEGSLSREETVESSGTPAGLPRRIGAYQIRHYLVTVADLN